MNYFGINMIRKIILVLVVATVSYTAVGGCGNSQLYAPFGSDIQMLNPPSDRTIPPDSISNFRVQALVTGPDGEPINGVLVRWDLSFAGINDLVVDTDGDGVADARALQFVNPEGCGKQDCGLVPISQWFSLGAFVDSPFETLTDDRGIADVIILYTGNVVVDPALLEVSTESGAVDSVEFSINTNQ